MRHMVLALASACALGANALGFGDLADRLASMEAYKDSLTFEVLLPQAEDPIVYHIAMTAVLPLTPDSLCACDYLISWQTDTPTGVSDGFSAYFAGNHYRYRNNRLQEYHIDAEPTQFQGNGVQNTAQFVDLLPQSIGRRLRQMEADSSYVFRYAADTLVDRRNSCVVEGVKRHMGYDSMRFIYVFDAETGLPRRIETENNPGSISEQLVTVTFANHESVREAPRIDEAMLIDLFPEVFERYRVSTFRTENLVGAPLPAFAARRLGSDERFSHHAGEGFTNPVVLVVLDPAVATTAQTIAAVREAVDMLPMSIDVVYAFHSNREEEITPLVAPLRAGETALVSAGGLVRDCGITLFPTTLFVNAAAVVKAVIPGFNATLPDEIIAHALNQ